MAKISKKTREELVEAIAKRYARASREDRSRILDEFVQLTGHHRKHAIRVLGTAERTEARIPRSIRTRVYDEAVREALVVLWESSDRICGKRLKPLLPILIPALERNGHLQLDGAVREKLLRISPATIDRLLKPTRVAAGNRRRRKKVPAVRGKIEIRTFADWNEPRPGFMEVDLVAHSGPSMAGRFAHTLVLTDIASGWTECIALAVKDSALVAEGLAGLLKTMPFPLRGIDTDNGSEFINDIVLAFCTEHGIDFTRSRPRRKNDQAWVEQKNGSVVRRFVGYGRLSGIAAVQTLSRLYESSRLFVNFFQPSFKLLEKERVGARVRKRYATPATPCGRLLARNDIGDDMKLRLQAVEVSLDPLRLLDEIRAAQAHLAGLVSGDHVHAPPHRDADLDAFLRSLSTAWEAGEVRPTHMADPKPKRYWRTREDPFADVWPQIVIWLETEPDETAKGLFDRLCLEHPSHFQPGQLRTLQRRVREWRSVAARKLLFANESQPFDDAVLSNDDCPVARDAKPPVAS